MKEEIAKLWNEYLEYLARKEQLGRGNWSPNDFTFDAFMNWVIKE